MLYCVGIGIVIGIGIGIGIVAKPSVVYSIIECSVEYPTKRKFAV
jgi:hypothetical protein